MINAEDFVTGLSYTLVAMLVNFITNKVYNYYSFDTRNFLWKKVDYELEGVFRAKPLEELIKVLEIVIIDDEDIFPVELFKDYEYRITKWDEVTSARLKELQSGQFDIIILDINGVAKQLSEEDGFAIIETIKSNNPSQILIAYSGQTYDSSKQKYWQMADDTIPKPGGFLRIKEMIDSIIVNQFTPERYLGVLRSILDEQGFNQSAKRGFELKLFNTISKGKNIDWNSLLGITRDRTVKRKLKITIETLIKNFSPNETR